MSESSRRADSEELEPPPQKLLLAPLLATASSGGAAGAAGAAAAAAVATATAAGNIAAFSKFSKLPETNSIGAKGDKVDNSVSSGRRSWWQITEADSDDETACLSSAPSDVAVADGRVAEQSAVEQMRHRLLITARLLNELQVENTSLCEALKRAREQWAVGADEGVLLRKDRDALRRDNESLRKELEETRERHEAEEHSKEQRENLRAADAEAREQRENLRAADAEAALDAARTEATRAHAELHKAQVALVSIVPELERRIDDRGAALEASELRVKALEAQLEEQTAATTSLGLVCGPGPPLSPSAAIPVAAPNTVRRKKPRVPMLSEEGGVAASRRLPRPAAAAATIEAMLPSEIELLDTMGTAAGVHEVAEPTAGDAVVPVLGAPAG